MPIEARKVVYRSLTPAAKAALWRHQLGRFVEENNLTPAQRAIVADAMALASPDLFSVKLSDPQWTTDVKPALQELEQRAKAAFPSQLALAAFGRLGPEDPVEPLTPIAFTPATTASGRTVHPQLPSNCTCTQESDFCWGTCGGGVCYTTDGGCGWWWQYDCVAMCQR